MSVFGARRTDREFGICSNTIIRCRVDGNESYQTCSAILSFIYMRFQEIEDVCIYDAGARNATATLCKPNILLPM